MFQNLPVRGCFLFWESGGLLLVKSHRNPPPALSSDPPAEKNIDSELPDSQESPGESMPKRTLEIVECPSCQSRVVPKADGMCPACRHVIA